MIQAIGKYRVSRLLGEGAMGAVYLAEDPDIGRPVAIKVMKMEAEEDHERFRQEARIVGGCGYRGKYDDDNRLELEGWAIGLNFRPSDNWVLKADYEWNDTDNLTLYRGDRDGFVGAIAFVF